MSGIPGRIIEEIGEVGKHIGSEVAKVPKEMAGKALETFGTSGGKKQGQQAQPQAQQGPLKEIDETKDQKIKESIARSALEQLAGRPKRKEPSVWEKMQMEAEEKKKMAQRQIGAIKPLPTMAGKRPRGDLYGVKAKRGAAEMSRNVKQD